MEREQIDAFFNLHASWRTALENEFNKPYIEPLIRFVEEERRGKAPVYPSRENVFTALNTTPFDEVRVVILGQDPYHGPGQAHGLCFSVQKGVPFPPSLLNIFKEMRQDIGAPMPTHGFLESWAKQGVLLLNTTLTVSESAPLSHFGKGWELFTDAIIHALAEKKDNLIFVLWGKNAQDKCAFIHKKNSLGKSHTLIKAPHPSPLSAHRGFFGSRPFSTVNTILSSQQQPLIDWRVI
ncbi:uracil-DNA glycosylase [Estrella lausannensis]|uniref:Uracil-DNA glycosylase n=1 Tax=Estrella lausannensis TaxID=483423 RepID=A0A0H5DPT2_9BACT|nr:uracil-DNA glycosylase [Estrella lausannensis]CRX37514.1 Uracil-DNA glycosylase [Estrella lausannensis]